MAELKPCPFCGGTNVELRAGVMFNGAVHCNDCTADVVFDAVRMIAEGDYDWQTAVTKGWNTRTTNMTKIEHSSLCETETFKGGD